MKKEKYLQIFNYLKEFSKLRSNPVRDIDAHAEIASIEKWGDTNKYILKFKEVAKAIGPISLDKEMGKKGLAPQAPRYTSLDKLLKAKKLSQVF